MKYQLLLQVLNWVATAVDAAAKARAVYDSLRESAQQSQELTPEESAALDARAEEIFASPASQPSGR